MTVPGPLAVPDPSVPIGQSLILDTGSPNPVLSRASIRFEVPAAGDYRIGIFDVGGRLVRDLLSERLDAGAHTVAWGAKDDGGRRVGPGVYFCRLNGARSEVDRKMVVVR